MMEIKNNKIVKHIVHVWNPTRQIIVFIYYACSAEP